jgi:hypothetical protein
MDGGGTADWYYTRAEVKKRSIEPCEHAEARRSSSHSTEREKLPPRFLRVRLPAEKENSQFSRNLHSRYIQPSYAHTMINSSYLGLGRRLSQPAILFERLLHLDTALIGWYWILIVLQVCSPFRRKHRLSKYECL